MEPKHTPGPWRYDPISDAIFTGGKIIADLAFCEAAADCRAANGFMMAAAPDLVAALKCLLAFDSTAYAKGSDRAEALLAAKKDAWAAIAKAEGGAP